MKRREPDRENAKARKKANEPLEFHSILSPSHNSHYSHNSHSAFTLIEILVALAIMVIVVGCTYGLYVGATRAAARYRARTEVERDARALLRMMSREVRCSYVPPSQAPTVDSSPAGTSGSPISPGLAPTVQPSPAGTSGSTSSPGSTPTRPNTPGAMAETQSDRPVYNYLTATGGGDGIFLQTLTTGGIADPDQPSSGLYNVAYRLDADRKMIWRRQLDMLEPQDSKAQESSWLCVARGVESVKCSCFDGQTWQEGWTTDPSTGLPYAVKIEIAMTDSQGHVSTYATSINVPLSAGAQGQTTTTAPAKAH